MPRVRRRVKARRAGYDEEHVRHLLKGIALSSESGFRLPGHETDWPAFREAWETLRDRLLPQWIAEHPGTRPYAWWVCDAPGRRERIDGLVHPFDDRVRRAHVENAAEKHPGFRQIAYQLFYGRPRCLCVADDFVAEYETELAYLDRLNLLTEAERAGLP